MSQFYLTSDSPLSSASSSPRSSIENALPFPTPLPRSDFLAPDFSPSTYLSDLAPSRHQVLEDLRSDLRVRSQQLSRELLDLVNAHYADFLGLGGTLRGGKEKVEEVRMGLMGFQREVEGVREGLLLKEGEIEVLVEERKRIRGRMEVGRALLGWEGRVAALESRLGMRGPGEGVVEQRSGGGSDDEESDSEADDEEEVLSDDGGDEEVDVTSNRAGAASQARLGRRIQEFKVIRQSAARLGSMFPFMVAQQPRLLRIRNTLLLDLSSCLQYAKGSPGRSLEVLAMYRELDAGKEAAESLRAVKGKEKGRV